MYIVFSVLILIVCVLLSIIVLVQNSKGGGLASNFSSSNQVMGVRKTTDFLEKATWTLAIALLVLSIGASMSIQRGEVEQTTALQENIQTIPDPTPVPQMPATAPEETATEAPQE